MLIAGKADISAKWYFAPVVGFNAAEFAAFSGSASSLRVLLAAKSDPGMTACTAAMNGHLSVLRVCTDAGVDLKKKHLFGMNPVHFAAMMDRYAAVEFLLLNGSNKDQSSGRKAMFGFKAVTPKGMAQ